jgi:hypothetical protein
MGTRKSAPTACFLYSGLEDAVGHGENDVDLADLGHRVILPSSYTGGPRYMNQRFQDAIALARYYHGFDLFLTFNDHTLDSETQRTESQSDEESRVANTLDVSTSPTRAVDFHVAGDIVHVRYFWFPRFHFVDIVVPQVIVVTSYCIYLYLTCRCSVISTRASHGSSASLHTSTHKDVGREEKN